MICKQYNFTSIVGLLAVEIIIAISSPRHNSRPCTSHTLNPYKIPLLPSIHSVGFGQSNLRNRATEHRILHILGFLPLFDPQSMPTLRRERMTKPAEKKFIVEVREHQAETVFKAIQVAFYFLDQVLRKKDDNSNLFPV